MKISTKGLYAVRFMVFLAGHGGTEPVPLKEIAEATSISRKYLEQIASSLAAAQLVRSARGASGGYRLARSAMNITMLDVLTVTEGSLAPLIISMSFPGKRLPVNRAMRSSFGRVCTIW